MHSFTSTGLVGNRFRPEEVSVSTVPSYEKSNIFRQFQGLPDGPEVHSMEGCTSKLHSHRL